MEHTVQLVIETRPKQQKNPGEPGCCRFAPSELAPRFAGRGAHARASVTASSKAKRGDWAL